MDIPMSSGYMKKKCLHIEVNHGCEELHKSSCYVQQNGIDTNVPIYIIKVYPSDVWHPRLETMIFVPHTHTHTHIYIYTEFK
jgi:predicted RNA-binding protein